MFKFLFTMAAWQSLLWHVIIIIIIIIILFFCIEKYYYNMYTPLENMQLLFPTYTVRMDEVLSPGVP